MAGALGDVDMIERAMKGLMSRWRQTWLRLRGVRIRGNCRLRSVDIPRNHRDIELRDGVALDQGVALLSTGGPRTGSRIIIGERVYVNRSTMLDASERIEIGKDSMIGPFCYITDHDHEIAGSDRPADGGLPSAPTGIGERCWLGAHVTVLKGVTIGKGSVIGAGSVVTKSIPAGAVAVGNPARVIRQRELVPAEDR